MSKSYSSLRKQVLSDTGLAASFTVYNYHVEISEDLDIFVNNDRVEYEAKTLEEANKYARSYVENIKLLENIDTTIPEEKVAQYIRQYHDIDKITDTLIESYIELASSNVFTVDPVVTAIKESKSSEFAGKLQFKLDDGSVVAIDESTQESLNILLENHNDVVEFMRQSKNNFMRIIKELEE
jgi:predicted house-cleaning noncanonical NTP pyrophosphatase (MazG superfamily)